MAYYNTPEQKEAIEKSMARFDQLLEPSQYGPIVTEVSEMPEFFFAEDYVSTPKEYKLQDKASS